MRKLLSFSRSQLRGILLLLPILLIISVFVSSVSRIEIESSFLALSDTLANSRDEMSRVLSKITPEEPTVELFDFDPNTIDYHALRKLGFSSSQAAGIIKYRTKYNIEFELPTDFAALYQVSDSMFLALEHYIKIPQKASLLSEPQISEELKSTEEPQELDINTASFEQLVALSGIGELTATRIINYRERLGGYSKISQLLEVEGVLEKNYLKFCEEIFVKNDCISKIDINFALAEIMSEHPYMEPIIIRKVLKHRQLKGGLGNITEMIEAHILTEQQAEKLADYLIFNTQTPQ